MSLRQAVELIRGDLPTDVLGEIESRPWGGEADLLEAPLFSLSRVRDVKGCQFMRERRLMSIAGGADERAAALFPDQLSFIADTIAASTGDHLWSGYCIIEMRCWIIFKEPRRVWFLVDTARKKVLKQVDPIGVFLGKPRLAIFK